MSEIVYAGQQAIWLVIVLSAWPVIVATIIGLVIGAMQTVIQLQEQTLPFGIKLFGVGACLYIGSKWAGSTLLAWSMELVRLALKPAGA
ncbi:MAG TPA: EscS/YscS/HrcS family type III secretion system export apparatus protein [Pararobbsia sp.]|jgi:type III secretion protein S|nr:EscS/YscS/HrcS family type III secretion system export apparatus protein [Pararobbsia sp.]